MPNTGAVPIQPLGLVIAALFVVCAGTISLVLQLGLARRLLIGSLRTVAQLLLVGYVLGWVFALQKPAWVIGVACIMIAAAAYTAVQRSKRRYRGVYLATFTTLTATGLVTTIGATEWVIRVSPWWRPQYLIPLLGMVLGNGLTGLSLCLEEMTRHLDVEYARIETDLALGASRWEAARGPVREAVRRGMIPVINSMMVVGIVSLPGMMTGQILGGADPTDAVRYQIVIMFMIAASTSLGCMLLTLHIYWRLFDKDHRLRREQFRRS